MQQDNWCRTWKFLLFESLKATENFVNPPAQKKITVFVIIFPTCQINVKNCYSHMSNILKNCYYSHMSNKLKKCYYSHVSNKLKKYYYSHKSSKFKKILLLPHVNKLRNCYYSYMSNEFKKYYYYSDVSNLKILLLLHVK